MEHVRVVGADHVAELSGRCRVGVQVRMRLRLRWLVEKRVREVRWCRGVVASANCIRLVQALLVVVYVGRIIQVWGLKRTFSCSLEVQLETNHKKYIYLKFLADFENCSCCSLCPARRSFDCWQSCSSACFVAAAVVVETAAGCSLGYRSGSAYTNSDKDNLKFIKRWIFFFFGKLKNSLKKISTWEEKREVVQVWNQVDWLLLRELSGRGSVQVQLWGRVCRVVTLEFGIRNFTKEFQL